MSAINPTGSGAWKRNRSTIIVSQTKVVHSVPLTLVIGLRYVLTAYSRVEQKTYMSDVSFSIEGSTISSRVFGKSGSTLVDVSGIINGGSFELTLTNKMSYDLNIDFAYLTLGSF